MNTSYILSIYNTDDQEVNTLAAILPISPDSNPLSIIQGIVRDNCKDIPESEILGINENVNENDIFYEDLSLYYIDPATGYSIEIDLDQE